MDATANVKVARDYFISKQNTVLIPSKEFGKRKFIHVGSSSSLKSTGKQKSLEGGGIEEDNTPQVLTMKSALKQWVHPPDKLLTGHIVYNVKVRGTWGQSFINVKVMNLFLFQSCNSFTSQNWNYNSAQIQCSSKLSLGRVKTVCRHSHTKKQYTKVYFKLFWTI